MPFSPSLLQRIEPFIPSGRTLGLCIATYALVVAVALAAPYLLPYGPTRGAPNVYIPMPWYHNWDGLWYVSIVENGYFYDPDTYSSVAFYPLYPLLGACVKYLTGLSASTSLVVVNVISLTLLCGIWEAYARQYSGNNGRFAWYALCLVLFYPASFYLRAAYPMALLMALLTLALYGFRAQWSIPRMMVLCILLTSCHSTGFALIPALGWYAWKQLRSLKPPFRLVAIGGIMGVSGSGLWLYMLHQWITLGSPFYFFLPQKAWSIGDPVIPSLLELVTLTPVWYPLTTLSEYRLLGISKILFNHGLFLAVIFIFIYGCKKRWLNAEETISGTLMFLLYYYFVLQQGQQQWSTGRYSMLIMPCYLIMARLMVSRPKEDFFALLFLSEILLCWCTILYAQWYAVY